MSEQALIQFRVDKELKQEAAEICDALGTDLPTVFRMCMKQMKIVRGIPFSTRLPEGMVTREEALRAFDAMRRQAADVPEMTLDEINAEISASRAARKAGKVGFHLSLRHGRSDAHHVLGSETGTRRCG